MYERILQNVGEAKTDRELAVLRRLNAAEVILIGKGEGVSSEATNWMKNTCEKLSAVNAAVRCLHQ